MDESFLFQAGVVFWSAVCFFAYGGRVNGVRMDRVAWREVIQAAVMVTLAFGLATEWRGCRATGQTAAPTCDSTGVAGEEC